MPQFTVYRNKNPQTLSAVPFLLDVQHDLLNDLETRVVIPFRSISRIIGVPGQVV
jgi:toxin CcdB